MKISITCSLFVLANFTLSAASFYGAFTNGSQAGGVEECASLSDLAAGAGGSATPYGTTGRNYDNGIAFNSTTQTWFGAFSGGTANNGGVREFPTLTDLTAGTNVISSVSYISSGITYSNGICFNSDTQSWFAAYNNGNSKGVILEFANLNDLARIQNPLQQLDYATNSLDYSNGITYDPEAGLWYAAVGPSGGSAGQIQTFQSLASLAGATNVQSTVAYGSNSQTYDNFITVATPPVPEAFSEVALIAAFNGGSGVGALREFVDPAALGSSTIASSTPYANNGINYANGIAYNSEEGTWVGSTFDSSNQRVIYEFSTVADLAASQSPIATYSQSSRFNNGIFFNALTQTWFGADDGDNSFGVISEFASLSDLASSANAISQTGYSSVNTSYDNGVSYDAKSDTWFGAFSGGSQIGAIRAFASLADLAASTNRVSQFSYSSSGLNYSNFFTVRAARSASSELEVEDFSFDPASGESRISFAVPATGSFQVQYSDNLQTPWTDLPNSAFDGGLGIFTHVDSASASVRRFYRAAETPLPN